MPPFTDAAFAGLAKKLAEFSLDSTITQVAGLLTVPSLQPFTLRLELLAHLAILHCQGTRASRLHDVTSWIRDYLGDTPAALLEDPPEDVFLSNVRTASGNRRLFEGLWESADFSTQQLLDVLSPELVGPIDALLTLSESVADTLNLPRWLYVQPPAAGVRFPSSSRHNLHTDATIFDNDRLATLDIDSELLQPFVLREQDHTAILSETIHHTSLERRPIISINDRLVLAVPTAVSAAVRRFALAQLTQTQKLAAFAQDLSACETRHVDSLLATEIANESTLITMVPPLEQPAFPPLFSWVINYDRDKYLHVVLLSDALAGAVDNLTEPTTVDDHSLDAVRNYLTAVARRCRSLPSYSTGFTLLIIGGLGHARAVPFPDTPNAWISSVIRLADFSMLMDEGRAALDRYLKCISQRRLAESLGLRIQAFDDYGFYCHWLENQCRAVPLDASFERPCLVAIPSDSPLPVRLRTRQRLDRHAAQRTDGTWATVFRLTSDNYFSYMQSRPIYACLEDAQARVLRGVVETDRGATWFSVVGHKNSPAVMSLLYQAWSGFIELFERLVTATESTISEPPTNSVEVCLDFTIVVMPSAPVTEPTTCTPGAPGMTHDLDAHTITITWPEGFWTAFQGPANAGETMVIRHAAAALLALHGNPTAADTAIDVLVRAVIPRDGLRVVHLFAGNSFEHLLEKKAEAIEPATLEDVGFLSPKLADGCYPGNEGTVLSSSSECGTFLHKLVDKILDQLTQNLGALDRTLLIRRLYGIHDGVLHDREHWRRTSLALETLHGADTNVTDVVRKRENERSQLGLSARCLLEIAICECPAVGGRAPSRWDVDRLLAQARTLLQAATDSDALFHGLCAPSIVIHPNGEYDADRSFLRDVVEPYVAGYSEETFQGDVGKYGTYYVDALSRNASGIDFADEFNAGFLAEYGLLPDETLSGFAELMDLALDRQEVIIETTVGELGERLTNRRGLSEEARNAFIRTFSIFHRPVWTEVPKGFRRKDLYPWRFRRPLSLIVRPLLAFGMNDTDKVLFGAATLRVALSYVIGKTRDGTLPQSFFRTEAMKGYAGAMNNRRGREFTEVVAKTLRRFGWRTRTEVKMTELGATADYGDVDVLAWKATGDVQIIECKCLYLARTVAEIAEICNRFRGEAKDELAKHVRRVRWIEERPDVLRNTVAFVPVSGRISHRLVTNTHVPMQYMEGLPMEPALMGLPRWMRMDARA